MGDNEVENKDLCNKCQQLLSNKDDNDGIECEMFNCWVHYGCVEITKSELVLHDM